MDTLIRPAEPGAEPLALRPREAARMLGVCPRTLWTMTRERGVPHVRLGRAVLYPVRGLERWLAEQSRTSEAGEEGRS